ncbi:MAG: NAD(P) transhydrogenase subunit alpha [Proteobacteria bacterium]|nr:NAD(P) transhydrogenase subunit alpha [Pseudomonadota bacterium]NBX86477.1 NAD(P) transhydrogenase subunit alpha [Pseudomonadota bacterium]
MDLNPLTILTIIFVLSCLVGYFVVWGVTPALHTPLMAVTNAISGIVIIAAILITGPEIIPATRCAELPCPYPEQTEMLQLAAQLIGTLAVALCAINIFGGFAITRRMLNMFKRKGE